MMATIYALCEPATGEVRYIGKANDAQARLKSHIRDSNRRNTPVYAWMRSLARAGRRPALRVLLDSERWQDDERRLIAEYRAAGARLLNVAEGGDEPACTPEVRVRNARRLVQALMANERLAFVQRAKRQLAMGLRQGTLPESAKATMRAAAARSPRLFGEWSSV
jgi:hypothetical protein